MGRTRAVVLGMAILTSLALISGWAGTAGTAPSKPDVAVSPDGEGAIDATPTLGPTATPANRRGPFRVVRVADGDTLTVRIGGDLEKVRVVGINTPESVDPRRPVQCFGREASAQAKLLLGGKSVWLERDVTQSERDRYGRMLAFVWLDDETDFGLKMIREGFALEYTYKLPYRDQAVYRQAQQRAMAQRVGLWSPQTCDGDTTRPA